MDTKPLKVRDIAYQATGMVVAFNDGSVATGVYRNTPTGLTIFGFSPAQEAAIKQHNTISTSGRELDPRLSSDEIGNDFRDGQVAVWNAVSKKLVGRGGDNPGGASYGCKTITTNYQILVKDYAIRVDLSGGDITITLPTALESIGSIFVIKRIIEGGILTLVAKAGEHIDDLPSLDIIGPKTSFTVMSTGQSWDLI